MATSTPWGLSASVIKYAPGINWYDAERGKGFHLSLRKHQSMPGFLRKLGTDSGWFAGGGPDAAVIVAYPEYFTSQRIRRAHQTLKDLFPQTYQRLQEARVDA